MVEEQLRRRGIRDPRVLEAMAEVPRHRFLPAEMGGEAYADSPKPIGAGQMISQPYIVALMLEHLRVGKGKKVLEIGTGSGYQTALLARLGAEVFSIERVPELAKLARERMEGTGLKEIRLRVGDGSLGWPEEAPFDRVVVTACAPRLPQTLMEQMADGGILLAPVGAALSQELVAVERRGNEFLTRPICECLFVPLIGEEGWSEDPR